MSSHGRARPRRVPHATTNSCREQTTPRKKGQKKSRRCQSSNRSAKSPRLEVSPRNSSRIADSGSQCTYPGRGHILGIRSELASGFNCSRSRFNPQITVVIGVTQHLRVSDCRNQAVTRFDRRSAKLRQLALGQLKWIGDYSYRREYPLGGTWKSSGSSDTEEEIWSIQ